jgi:cell division protein FtsI/penicillin-binding protein 2
MRGAILDRNGRVLVRDIPASDVCIHFGVLAGREDYLRAVAIELQRRGDFPRAMKISEITGQLRSDIADMWRRLSELSSVPISELRLRADAIVDRVARVRASRARRSGRDEPVREEIDTRYAMHPLVEDVDNDVALNVRLELEKFPWLQVVPGARRAALDADAAVHVLGRIGAASLDRIDEDDFVDDELRGLRPDDRCGISGAERVAEYALRGRRGRIVQDFAGQELDRTEPALADGVRGCVHPAGASAAVVDVETREIVALASYHSYAYDDFGRLYEELSENTRELPLLFRAVQAQYPPGSTCKAITLMGGLGEGVINENERIHCTGFLLATQPNAFRCWIYNQYPGTTHDMREPAGQSGEDAIRNSCNIYFYKVGERLGAERLCEWFSRFGLGRTCGTGLIEESRGIVPTQERLSRPHEPADAWNFAIGQGEVTATPLQAANVAATIASGVVRPVRLFREDLQKYRNAAPEPAPPEQRFDERALRVLRAGMWRVVNEQGGTGHVANLERRDFELCGKTGSAQTVTRPVTWRFTFEWPDGVQNVQTSVSEVKALKAARDERPGLSPPRLVGRYAAQRYPELLEGERLPAHAWFMGYIQPRTTRRGAAPAKPCYAISIILEYGGSGGQAAGPIAKRIAEALLDRAIGTTE